MSEEASVGIMSTQNFFRRNHIDRLPDDWTVEYIEGLAERGSGHTPNKRMPEYWNGGIKWVSLADSSKLDNRFIYETDKEISEAGIANSSAVLHPAGTVVVSRDAGVGKSAILASDMAVSQHFIAWRCGPYLDNLFLYYWLQFTKPEFERMATGSTIMTIGLPYFKTLQIVKPPLPEQRRIAEILGAWDDAIALTRRLIDALKRRKQRLMQLLLTGRMRFQDFGGQEWQEVQLQEIATVNPPRSNFFNDDMLVSFVTMADVSEEAQLINSTARPYEEVREGFTSFQNGDVLVAKITPCFENGKGALVSGLTNGVGFGSTEFHVVRADSAYTSPSFLYYHLTEQEFRGRGGLNMVGSAGQKRVPASYLRDYQLMLPPLEEQSAISNMLEACDTEIAILQEIQSAYQEEKKGLMQRLLTGQIRVRMVQDQ